MGNNVSLAWMTPLDKLTFQMAVKRRLATVELSEHRIFVLSYNGDQLHYKPSGNGELVPRGNLLISKVLDDSWLDE